MHRNAAKEGCQCPLWVKSGHSATSKRCPLCPRKRTLVDENWMSALCHKRTHAPQQLRPLLGCSRHFTSLISIQITPPENRTVPRHLLTALRRTAMFDLGARGPHWTREALTGLMAEERVNRKLAAILAADVVGYSRLMASDEEGTLAALKRHRQTVFE